MKKLLNIAAAALASTMLFVGCSNGVAEPEKADDGVKVIDNEIDLEGYLTDLGWYPTFTMAGSDMLGVTEKKAKITFTYQMDEGAEYTQFGVFYDNLYDDSGITTEDHKLEEWKVYDGKIYNEKGVAQTLSGGQFVQISQAEPIVLYINLTEAQGKAFAKRGMVIQGENCTLTGLTISYEGEVIIERNVKDFAKATGTVTGSKNTKLMLNPDNANETVIGIIGIKNTESSNAVYKFEEPTDFTGLSRVRITARSGYKYGLNSDKTDVEKKSTYINGWETDTYATYINWDAAFKTNDSSNQLFFKTYNGDKVKDESEWVAAKIKDFYPDYTDPNALAYGLNEYSADNGEKLNRDAVFLQEGKEYSKWCMRYVLTEKCENVETAKEKRVHVGHKEGGYLTVTLFTDDNTSSTITVKDDVPAEFTEVTLAFKDFTKIADDVKDSKTGKVITKGKKVDLKKVTGIKIETGESSGDLYIKAINFDF